MVRKVRSFELRTLSEVTLDEKRDGAGSIMFGPTHTMSFFAGAPTWPGSFRPPVFDTIADAKTVYEQIRSVRSES